MRILFFLVAATAVGTASADTHVGNGEVHDTFGVADPIEGHGEANGGAAGGGSGGGTATSPPVDQPTACPTIIPADGPEFASNWWARPVCGQPPAPQCNNSLAVVCPQIMPAQKTYPNCRALNAAGATLVHVGRCRHEPRPEPESQRIAIGFDVKNFHQCVARVSHAKRLRPALAPWIQSDGKPMKTREFCKRLFNPPVVEPQAGVPSTAAEEDQDDDNDVVE